MISYALSACAFGNYVTEQTVSALRQTKFRNFEPYPGSSIGNDEKSLTSSRLTPQTADR